MHRFVKNCAILLTVLSMGVAILQLPFLMSVSKAAGTNPTLTMGSVTNSEYTKIKNAVNAINREIQNDKVLTDTRLVASKRIGNRFKFLAITKPDSKDTCEFTVDMSQYSNVSAELKQRMMEIALEGIKDSGISKINRTKLYNFIADNDESTANLVRSMSTDIRGDFASAYESFKPFNGVLGWILGFLTILILAFLGIGIVIDLAYIVIPLVQVTLSKSKESEKPALISLEAWTAVKNAEQGNEFKEPLSIFLKLKTKQFVALGICLLYLVQGKLFELVAGIIDYFSGLVG